MEINELAVELYEALYAKVKNKTATPAEVNLQRTVNAFLTKAGLRKSAQEVRSNRKFSNVPTVDPTTGSKIETFVKKEVVGAVDPFEAARNHEANGGKIEKPEIVQEVIEEDEDEEGNVLATSEDKSKRTRGKNAQK